MHTKRERHTHSQGDTHTLRDIHKERHTHAKNQKHSLKGTHTLRERPVVFPTPPFIAIIPKTLADIISPLLLVINHSI